ncbi:MAG: GDP-L-fucose synthase [Desulfatirhabdiaceae bacterium]|nr:GDP-L-fucose synthase [Desulfatirhabdiaceae bacterium]
MLTVPPLTLDSRIFVAGHRGMVGSAIVRFLKAGGHQRLIVRTHRELDLMDQQAVRHFFRSEPIDYVVLAAAKVGGIFANNTYRADFIYQNLMIECNVIHEAFSAGVRRLLFLGSSCIYPRHAPQPMKEAYLLSGVLEPTNQPYAIAKIAGIELCQSYNRQHGTLYRCVMPTNLYGPNDSYDLNNSHVLPALIRKFHLARLVEESNWSAIQKDEAVFGPIPDSFRTHLGIPFRYGTGILEKYTLKQAGSGFPDVLLWGTGSARREFLHVDDMASGSVFIMQLDDSLYDQATQNGQTTHINIGTGEDLTIRELSDKVKAVTGYSGRILWDHTQPDGTPQKLLDVSILNRLGWKPAISLSEGLRQTYQAYQKMADIP